MPLLSEKLKSAFFDAFTQELAQKNPSPATETDAVKEALEKAYAPLSEPPAVKQYREAIKAALAEKEKTPLTVANTLFLVFRELIAHLLETGGLISQFRARFPNLRLNNRQLTDYDIYRLFLPFVFDVVFSGSHLASLDGSSVLVIQDVAKEALLNPIAYGRGNPLAAMDAAFDDFISSVASKGTHLGDRFRELEEKYPRDNASYSPYWSRLIDNISKKEGKQKNEDADRNKTISQMFSEDEIAYYRQLFLSEVSLEGLFFVFARVWYEIFLQLLIDREADKLSSDQVQGLLGAARALADLFFMDRFSDNKELKKSVCGFFQFAVNQFEQKVFRGSTLASVASAARLADFSVIYRFYEKNQQEEWMTSHPFLPAIKDQEFFSKEKKQFDLEWIQKKYSFSFILRYRKAIRAYLSEDLSLPPEIAQGILLGSLRTREAYKQTLEGHYGSFFSSWKKARTQHISLAMGVLREMERLEKGELTKEGFLDSIYLLAIFAKENSLRGSRLAKRLLPLLQKDTFVPPSPQRIGVEESEQGKAEAEAAVPPAPLSPTSVSSEVSGTPPMTPSDCHGNNSRPESPFLIGSALKSDTPSPPETSRVELVPAAAPSAITVRCG